MQQRFHISYHKEYDEALEAKKKLLLTRPNENFQIRKRENNFELVGRTSYIDSKTFAENVEGRYTQKKRKPKKAWRKSINAGQFILESNNQKARDNNTGKWTGRDGNYQTNHKD